MRVGDLQDSHDRDLLPIQPAVFFRGNRIIGGLDNQSIRMIQIEGDLPGAIPDQLVGPRLRQKTHFFQGIRRAQFIQPSPEPIRPLFTVLFPGELRIIAFFFQLSRLEEDIHDFS